MTAGGFHVFQKHDNALGHAFVLVREMIKEPGREQFAPAGFVEVAVLRQKPKQDGIPEDSPPERLQHQRAGEKIHAVHFGRVGVV